MYGWFSFKQAEIAGIVEYTTTTEGSVYASEVSEDINHQSNWDDAIFLGQVVKFVRRATFGTKGEQMCEENCWEQ